MVEKNLGKDVRRLQSRIFELQKENNVLRAALSDSSANFYTKIVQFIQRLHDNPKFSDFEFKTPERSIPGHSFVLEARGGAWNILSDSGSKFVELVSKQPVCEALICWLYTDEIRETQDCTFLSEMILLASRHELFDLVEQCGLFLLSLLDQSNCIQLYDVAHRAKAHVLLERAGDYLAKIWPSISAPDLRGLSPPVLLSILQKQTAFPLHQAIKFNRSDVAHLLLEDKSVESHALVNSLDSDGLSPLFLALELELFEFAESLLRHGAKSDLLIGPGLLRVPTGHYAVLKRNLSILDFLLNHGYPINSRMQPSDTTLLHLISEMIPSDAQLSRYTGVTSFILDHRGYLPVKDLRGNTPLHTAVMHYNKKALELFLEQAELFDLNAINNLGMPPVWYAICADFGDEVPGLLQAMGFSSDNRVGVLRFTEKLIKAGADVNFRFTELDVSPYPAECPRPNNCDTLLMACARCGFESACLSLMKHGCSIDAESTMAPGETVFHLCVERNLARLAECLAVKPEADPNKIRVKSIKKSIPIQKPSPPIEIRPKSPKPVASISTNPFDTDDEDDSGCLGERFDPDGQVHEDLCNGIMEETIEFVEQQTPLHIAVSQGMTKLIELYLNGEGANSPDWFILDHHGESVFSIALWNHRFDLASRVLVSANRQYHKRIANSIESSSSYDNALDVWDSLWHGFTLLHRAVALKDLEVVRFLLRNGVNVNKSFWKSPSGFRDPSEQPVSPLWCALQNCQFEITSLLVSHKADINGWSRYGTSDLLVTLLHRALQAKSTDAALFLIRSGCEVNPIPRFDSSAGSPSAEDVPDLLNPAKQWSPIHLSALQNLPAVTLGLLESKRADVNKKDADGNTALHLAVKVAHNQVLSRLLHHAAPDCTIRNNAGHTAFHVAMIHRNVEAAQTLIKRDRTLSLQTDNSGRNFLHIALQNLDRDAVFFLIQTGMDMNQRIKDATQHAPIHVAIIAGVPEDVLLSMILAGADITARTPQQYTTLHLCVLHDRPEMLNALIEHGADVNAQDAEMNTPLHLALRKANIPCLAILLSLPRTNCNIINIRGQLPIHMLAEHDPKVAVDMLHYLLEVRPDMPINARDASGDSALLLAYRAGNIPLCIALQHAGAALGLANLDGQTVFTMSRSHTASAFPDRALAQILSAITQEPRWVDGQACSECYSKFNLTCRKHHCRHCGRVLCTQCSNWELPIIKFGLQKPVRVCETCFGYLVNPFDV